MRQRAAIVRHRELEIAERTSWPLIVAINYGAVCHISRKVGILRAGNRRHGNKRDQLYALTECGRALRYTIHERTVPADEFLCARCGERVDFQAVMEEHDLAWAVYCEEERVKDAAKTANRLLERDRRTAVLKALYEALALDYDHGRSWSPVTGKTDRGQHVIYLNLDTHLPRNVITENGGYGHPYEYRAVVSIERIPPEVDEG